MLGNQIVDRPLVSLIVNLGAARMLSFLWLFGLPPEKWSSLR